MTALKCPGCTQAMRAVALPGHYDKPVEVDHCDACRLVWFDALEFSALGKAGWVALLTAMARADNGSAPPSSLLPQTGRCPRCTHALVTAHNLTRFGRFAGAGCPAGHGQAQRDSALLASRGLFRPLLLAERTALALNKRTLQCQGCGAALDGQAEHCGFCQAPVVVVDLPRLAIAVGLHDEAAVDRHRQRGDAPPVQLWACHACGAALDPTRQPACPQCRYPVLAPRLADLLPLLQAAAERLKLLATRAQASALRTLSGDLRKRVASLSRRPAHTPRSGPLPLSVWAQRLNVLLALTLLLLALAWLAGP